jgi:uncharacterized repeat protein (TIGR01451 family)
MKMKFYSMKVLCFSLLLSIGIGNSVKGQTISLTMENLSTGLSGTVARPNQVLAYTISGSSTADATLIDDIPAGTSYVAGSTTLNGSPVADVSSGMPYANTGGVIPLALNPFTVVFQVVVSANLGTITNTATLQTGGSSINSDTRSTIIYTDPSCGSIYVLTTSSTTGRRTSPPFNLLPYLYIRLMDPLTPSGTVIYNGVNGLCEEAPLNPAPGQHGANLPNGSILTDATAMGQMPNRSRLYFVNKPVNNVPADLCYLDVVPDVAGVYIAQQYTGKPLTTNTASDITRMTFDAEGKGYALTENGLEFIRFTIDAITNIPTIDAPVLLQNDPANGTHDFKAETGGDFCSDGSGKLLLVVNSGNVYRIDPATGIVKFEGTITLTGVTPFPGCNSVAMDGDGYLYIGGLYTKVYKVTVSTMTGTVIFGSSRYASSDFASCIIPLKPARVATNENTVRNNPDAVQLSTEVFAKVQPNPFNKELNVQVQLNTEEVVKVRLIDFYGRTVYTSSQKLSTGVNSLHVPVPAALGSGMYVLELWTGNNRLLQKKLLKQ